MIASGMVVHVGGKMLSISSRASRRVAVWPSRWHAGIRDRPAAHIFLPNNISL